MVRVIDGLPAKYRSDPALAGVLDSFATEVAMYRKYSPYYGYTFFIAKK